MGRGELGFQLFATDQQARAPKPFPPNLPIKVEKGVGVPTVDGLEHVSVGSRPPGAVGPLDQFQKRGDIGELARGEGVVSLGKESCFGHGSVFNRSRKVSKGVSRQIDGLAKATVAILRPPVE